MAEYTPAPQLEITDTFTTLVSDFNTVSSGLGATGDLTTNVKTTIVGAINELEVGIRGVSNNLVATDLDTNATDLVTAINEIEGVFDASAKGISAGTYAFDITTTHASGISLAAPITSLTGKLGIGTASPTHEIQIESASPTIRLVDTDGNQTFDITQNGGNTVFDYETGIFFKKAGGTEIVRFDAAGVDVTGTLDVTGNTTVTGTLNLSTHLDMPDAAKIKLGNDDDFILEHVAGGSVSKILGQAIRIRNLADTETMASFNADGSTNLFYNGLSRLGTTATGIAILNGGLSDAGSLELGVGALITSGGTDAMTFSNANVTMAGNATVSGTLSVGSLATSNSSQTVRLAINELHGEVNTNTGNISTNTTAITANTNARTTNTSNITTNTTNITNNDSDISANATNISTNSSKIGTALSGNHLTAGNIGASLNTLASKIGDVTAINMGTDATTLVTAINELHLEIFDINENGPDANASIIGTGSLDTNATTLKGAINEIEGVFDASAFEISAGTNAFGVTSGAFTIDASGTITLDAATTALSGDLNMSTDTGRLRLGASNDLIIFHNGSDSYIQDNGTGDLIIRGSDNISLQASGGTVGANFAAAGAVTLNHAGNQKIITKSTGAGITGQLDLSSHLDMPDDAQIKLGTGDDLKIFHDGSNSYIQDVGTGNLFIDATSLRLRTGAGTETYLTADGNGSVDLYYDNAKKLETTSTGIDVTGNIDLDNGAKIRSNGADAITLSGANVTIAGNTTVSGTLSIGSLNTSSTTVAAAINELHGDIGTNTSAISSNDTDISTINTKLGTITTGVMLTSASNVGAAIGELHGDIGTNASAISANTSNITANTNARTTNTSSINNINTKLGTISSAAMGTTASNVSDAIDELRLRIPIVYNAAGTALN